MDFRPDLALDGDPQRNQQQFLVFSSSEPFEVLRVNYAVEGGILATQSIETEMDVNQRLPLFQGTLRKLTQGRTFSEDLPVELAVQYRRLGSEVILEYSLLLQQCRKPGILRFKRGKR